MSQPDLHAWSAVNRFGQVLATVYATTKDEARLPLARAVKAVPNPTYLEEWNRDGNLVMDNELQCKNMKIRSDNYRKVSEDLRRVAEDVIHSISWELAYCQSPDVDELHELVKKIETASNIARFQSGLSVDRMVPTRVPETLLVETGRWDQLFRTFYTEATVYTICPQFDSYIVDVEANLRMDTEDNEKYNDDPTGVYIDILNDFGQVPDGMGPRVYEAFVTWLARRHAGRGGISE